MERQIVEHIIDASLHGAACRPDMAAASEIGSHTAYIHPSVGPKTHLELLNGRLIEENGHFHAGGVPQLAHDAVQILAGDTVEIQIFFPKGADDAFSIHQKHALQKGTAQDLVLKIGLLEKGLIPDPFYRDNELDALKLMENDFAYETEIVIGEEDRKADRLFLHFDGIDTIADVYLNGEKIGSADNMNRVWEYDITDLVAGDAADTVYQVKVILHSPTKFIAEEDTKCPVGGSSDAMPGFPHIRKAACMYGWDWGPRSPTMARSRKMESRSFPTSPGRISYGSLSIRW